MVMIGQFPSHYPILQRLIILCVHAPDRRFHSVNRDAEFLLADDSAYAVYRQNIMFQFICQQIVLLQPCKGKRGRDQRPVQLYHIGSLVGKALLCPLLRIKRGQQGGNPYKHYPAQNKRGKGQYALFPVSEQIHSRKRTGREGFPVPFQTFPALFYLGIAAVTGCFHG